jgi:hypothetical protein
MIGHPRSKPAVKRPVELIDPRLVAETDHATV